MGFCLVVIAVRMPWAIALANFVLLGFRFYRRHGCVQIYVTELTPSARGRLECILFFFLGQAVGCCVRPRVGQHRRYAGIVARHSGTNRYRLDLRFAIAANSRDDLTASAVRYDALIGYPNIFRQLANLPKNIDRHASTRVPIAADTQPFRFEQGIQFLANCNRTIFMEGAMIAEAVQIELE